MIVRAIVIQAMIVREGRIPGLKGKVNKGFARYWHM